MLERHHSETRKGAPQAVDVQEPESHVRMRLTIPANKSSLLRAIQNLSRDPHGCLVLRDIARLGQEYVCE